MKKTSIAGRTAFCSAMILIAAGFSFNATAQTPPQGEFGTVPDEKEPILSASTVLENGSHIKDEILNATESDQSVVLTKDGVSAKVTDTLVDKTSGDTSSEGQSNFYGLNAAVLATGGANLTLDNVNIVSGAEGSNGVFSTGKGTVINAKNIRIRTKKNSSRGLDATYGGTIIAESPEISTEGEHCASLATDRGEGTIIVKDGIANTQGEGSPVIYSTGDIRVSNFTGSAANSELAVIEGKNSITIEKSDLYAYVTGGEQSRKSIRPAVMLYQSMSGDANLGTASFTAKNSTFKNNSTGPIFYVTNTSASVLLSGNTFLTQSKEFLHVSGNESERGWGKKGANGGILDFTLSKQNVEGDIYCDSISIVNLNVTNGSKLKGTVNGSKEGTVNLVLDKKSSLELTGDSYVNVFTDEDAKLKNIRSNGYTLYYNKNAKENAWLNGASITLKDGGKLTGIEMQVFTAEKSSPADGKSVKDGAPQGGTKGAPQGGHHAGKEMPQPVTISGTVKLYGEDSAFVGITTEDGKEYTLCAMPERPQSPEAKGAPNGAPQGMGQGGPQGAPKGNPPAGAKAPDGKAPDAKGAPKGITMEDLKALEGKTVKLTGCIMAGEKEGEKPGKVPEKPSRESEAGGTALDRPQEKPRMQVLKDGLFVVFAAE